MTINTIATYAGPYSGNDIVTAFAYGFKITTESEIKVYETTALGVTSLLTLNVDYTVTGVGEDAGGTVVRSAGALETGASWLLRSAYTAKQLTDFNSQGAFYPDVHEDALDKLTMLMQQVLDAQTRTTMLPETYTGAADPALPVPVANKYIRWNAAGTALELVSGTTVVVTADIAYDNTGTNLDATNVEAAITELDMQIIQNKAALTTGLVGTAEFLINDDGVIKRMDASVLAELLLYRTGNVAKSVTGGPYIPEQTLTPGATITWTINNNSEAVVTLDQNSTLAVAAVPPAGTWATLRVVQSGTHTLAYSADFDLGDAGAPTLSSGAGAEDLLSFRSNGTKLQFGGPATGFS